VLLLANRIELELRNLPRDWSTN